MSTTTTRQYRGGSAGAIAPPTKAENAELRRHLGASDRRMNAAYRAGLTSRPRNPSWEWYGDEHLAWIDGRFERNRRRQEAAIGAVYRLVAAVLRLFCRRCRKHHPKAERRLRRLGRRTIRAARRAQARRDRRRWADMPEMLDR